MALTAEQKKEIQEDLKRRFGDKRETSDRDRLRTLLQEVKEEDRKDVAPVEKEKRSRLFSDIRDIKDTAGDIKEGFLGIGKQLFKSGEKIVDTAQEKDKGVGEKALEIGSEAFRGGSRAFGEGVLGLGKALLTQEGEERVKRGAEEVVGEVVKTEPVQDLIRRYESLDEDTKQQVDNALGYAEGLSEIIGGGVLKKTITESVDIASDLVSRGKNLIPKRAYKTVEEVIETADDVLKKTDTPKTEGTPSALRKTVEEQAPEVSLVERYAGLSPDIKKRLQEAGPDKVREYFDVAHARNQGDFYIDPKTGKKTPVPTVYEYGARQVDEVVDQLEKKLNDTGSDIGSVRKKLGTVQASVDQVKAVEDSFVEQLDRLNLEIKDGVVRQKPGTVTRVEGKSDIRVLNELYDEMKKVKQSPTLTNLIDLRNQFDGKIKFGKRAQEVSNSVDPVSRSVRQEIADQSATLVGKDAAGDLAEYSNYIEALTELRSYTERKAGGEYLLRLVLSGRGGDARKILQTVDDYTGVDLMNDATLMTLATDMVGNTRQKNLFRQEITKAGLDVESILTGDIRGIIGTILERGRDVIDEKAFIRAAEGKSINLKDILGGVIDKATGGN